MALLLIALAVWIASGVGQQILRWLGVLRDRPLERLVCATALGLGLAAYGVLALGLVGLLARGPVGAWWLLMAVCGVAGMRIQIEDATRWFARRRTERDSRLHNGGNQGETSNAWILVERLCGIGLAIMVGIGIVCCFRPPGGIEWDVLAYHLADPKLYILQHRIGLLPTEHHSNFPFTLEMLFTVGLLFNGFALANLFHLVYTILTALALIAFSARMLNRPSGYLAALLYATTPLVVWEASVAYIDLGAALYATLAIFAAISALEAPASVSGNTDNIEIPVQAKVTDGNAAAWIVVAGAMIGFALGVKYLALVPLGLICLLLLLRRASLRSIGLFLCVAFAVGSPWYVKNILWMHNPVYPFYLKVFPNSRYWSPDRERSYQSEQNSFGYPHSLRQPQVAVLNLLQSPWRMVTDTELYYNQGERTFCIWIGGLYGGLAFALLLQRRLPRCIIAIAWLTAAQLACWFFLAQIGRYLLQFLPLAALLGGYSAWRLAQSRVVGGLVPTRVWRAIVASLFGGQFLYVVGSLWALPAGGQGAVEFYAQTGLLPTAVSVPDAIAEAMNPERAVERLHRGLDVYAVEQWINAHTPADAGVVLYDEVRGFYLDRPYLWGNEKHSSYVPYDRIADGEGLNAWMQQHGYRYAIINLNLSPDNQSHGAPIDAAQATADLQAWYIDAHGPRERWRTLVGDALRKGLWKPVDIEHGNVVVQFGAQQIGAAFGDGDADHAMGRGQ